MNYRHLYHAGNFADVLKHGLLCWIVAYLQQKEAPLAFIDTHAGRGIYDLSAPEALKTAEAGQGIARVLACANPPAALEPYLRLVREQAAQSYPGSPLLLARMARPHDRITACELHPDEAAALRQATAGIKQVRVLEADGYQRLSALVPPPEKRGLVLMDPPFEQPDELSALAAAFIAAHRKWPTGVFLLWFPLKDRARFGRFLDELRSAPISKLSLCQLDVDRTEGMGATGLVIANAPYTLEAEWAPALAWLARTLARGPGASASVEDLGKTAGP
jgi:23S rRNA (adenine2030-N6)-methyltransferase